MTILIRTIRADELAWVNEQYASISFALSSESDYIVVAEVNGERAGIGRLTQVDGTAGELGGIFVLPEFRGQSIAATIVEFLLKNSTHQTLYCIPFAHLEQFYCGFGFSPVDQTNSIPTKIQHKINWCAARYPSSVKLLAK